MIVVMAAARQKSGSRKVGSVGWFIILARSSIMAWTIVRCQISSSGRHIQSCMDN